MDQLITHTGYCPPGNVVMSFSKSSAQSFRSFASNLYLPDNGILLLSIAHEDFIRHAMYIRHHFLETIQNMIKLEQVVLLHCRW